MDRTFLKQGAEAKLEKCTFYGKPCLVKERFKKKYRHAVLDKSLTTQRMKSEVRAMLRCRTNGKGPSQSYACSSESGKIQRDGRKFLDRFKSYLGSQISQSFNEVHIISYMYRLHLQPNKR